MGVGSRSKPKEKRSQNVGQSELRDTGPVARFALRSRSGIHQYALHGAATAVTGCNRQAEQAQPVDGKHARRVPVGLADLVAVDAVDHNYPLKAVATQHLEALPRRVGYGDGGYACAHHRRAVVEHNRNGGQVSPGAGVYNTYLADVVVTKIGNVEVARSIKRHAKGRIQLSRGSRNTIVIEARDSRTLHGGNSLGQQGLTQ